MPEQTEAQRLAEANETIVGVVENGPWVLITDPALWRVVGEYVADVCHSVAAAAGLDEAMEYAHNAMPQRLDTTSKLLVPDARDRLARHLYIEGWASERTAAERWDAGKVPANRMDDYRRAADAALAVITGQEAGR